MLAIPSMVFSRLFVNNASSYIFQMTMSRINGASSSASQKLMTRNTDNICSTTSKASSPPWVGHAGCSWGSPSSPPWEKLSTGSSRKWTAEKQSMLSRKWSFHARQEMECSQKYKCIVRERTKIVFNVKNIKKYFFCKVYI